MAQQQDHMLSTIDNPFNPHTQWEQWYQWDEAAGYHSSAFLARVARLSPSLSLVDELDAIEDAIEEIVTENVLGVYIKVPAPSQSQVA